MYCSAIFVVDRELSRIQLWYFAHNKNIELYLEKTLTY